MKRGNISRKVAASVMTGAMMVSMAGMGVCAAPIVGDGNHAIEAVSVQKTVTTDGHTYAPDTSFSFRVANGGEGTFEGNVVSAGVTGGLAEDENGNPCPAGLCALPGFVDSKNEEKTERNAGYLVVSQSGGGMLRQGTREGIRRTPANRGMRAHRIVKGLDISEDVCHGMCP